MDARRPLTADRVRRRCDPARFPFETTAGLAGSLEPPGQARAVEALRFGTGIRQDGFNLFAMGPAQTGRHAVVKALLESRARGEPVPGDVVYAHDFAHPHRPKAILLPAGRGRGLERDLDALVEDLRTAVPAALESEDHRRRKEALAEEIKAEHDRGIAALHTEAERRGLALLRTPLGFGFAPTRDGKVLSSEEYERLPDDARTRIEADLEEMQSRLREFLEGLPRLEKELRMKAKELARQATRTAVGHLIDELVARYAGLPAVLEHLEALRLNVIENADEFVKPSEPGPLALLAGMDAGAAGEAPAFRRCRVNLLVDRGSSAGAPVVHEDHPTYQNLVGRVEYQAQLGALVTDFLLVRAGALHRANGGYLVLDAHDLLLQPYAWEGLKRALKSREIRIESLGQMLSLVSTVSLEPAPIPLRTKVILVGERMLYYLLDALDPDFHSLFKVAADFEEDVERGEDGDLAYARLVAAIVARDGLRPFDRTAVAAVVEQGARMAGDSAKLSTRVDAVADLLREADFAASSAGRDVVRGDDVETAVAQQQRRDGRIHERVLEEIERGTFLIDTAGAKVGQINGLAVSAYGHFAFGRPARITARVRLGKGEVVDVEREVELGGPIHSKGVLILAGFLGSRYATDHPLSLCATVAFEQSYGPIEGDSASAAELLAILSALAQAPLAQSYAVTGSVNQNGEMQAIGAVNEKIEGFFDVCRARGVAGEHGVIIPASNVRHLMLRRDVVEAVAEGTFRIHAVGTIDEAIEILTGTPAGARDEAGRFPDGSINARVEARLVHLAMRRGALGAKAAGNEP